MKFKLLISGEIALKALIKILKINKIRILKLVLNLNYFIRFNK